MFFLLTPFCIPMHWPRACLRRCAWVAIGGAVGPYTYAYSSPIYQLQREFRHERNGSC